MLFLIALAYGMLCVRLRVALEASWTDSTGSAALRVGACGLYARYEKQLILGEKRIRVRTAPRHGRQDKKENPIRKRLRRRLVPYLRSVILGRRFESVVVHVRLGLGSAAETAIAAGAVHALACALLFPLEGRQTCDLRVTPDFDKACLNAYLRGIFSFQLGDIMLAALKAALKKRKEGFRWKSIPLRA